MYRTNSHRPPWYKWFFHSTPLISRRDNQPNSQGMNSPPLVNNTPVTTRMEPQITGSRQNIPQSVKSTVVESGVTYAVGESGALYAEPHVNMNVGNTQTMINRTGSFQPMFVCGGGNSTQYLISIMTAVP